MGIVSSLFGMLFNKKEVATEHHLKTELFYLSGVNYYTANIQKLACSNPAWRYTAAKAATEGMVDKPIYRYNYVNKPVKLIPDPTNPNDKYSVAVYFAGELVGYLKREDNRHVLDILNQHDIKYISGFIGGGDYKIVSTDGQITKSSDHFRIRVKIAYI